jgi:hypothetical protein
MIANELTLYLSPWREFWIGFFEGVCLWQILLQKSKIEQP